MSRANLTGGPAYITWDSLTFQPQDDEWSVELNPEFFTVKSNLKGTMGKVLTGVMAEVTISPMALSGTFATLLAKLAAPFALNRGTLLFDGTDKPLVIQTVDGRSETFAAAVITGFTINGAPGKQLISGLKFLCLRKNATALTDAAAFVADASSAYSEPSMDVATLVSDTFTLAWGATYTDIETSEDGFTFSPSLDLTMRKTAKQGVYNAMVNDVTASVSFTPENATAANFYDDWLKLDGADAKIGGVRSGNHAAALTATAGTVAGLLLTVPRMAFTKGGARFGSNSRISQVTLEALRPATGALFTLGQVPAP